MFVERLNKFMKSWHYSTGKTLEDNKPLKDHVLLRAVSPRLNRNDSDNTDSNELPVVSMLQPCSNRSFIV